MTPYVALSRVLLRQCGEYTCGLTTDEALSVSARALSTALAVMVSRTENPGTLLALIVRDISEAAVRVEDGKVQRKSVVVDFAKVRKAAPKDGEPA